MVSDNVSPEPFVASLLPHERGENETENDAGWTTKESSKRWRFVDSRNNSPLVWPHSEIVGTLGK